jgi:hypothetical protein
MSKHQLYYSKRCRFCQAFLEELSRTPYTREFALICVDPSPSRPPLPGWLKSVPSLLVAGEHTPRVGPGPVNNWLFERKHSSGGGSATASRERAHPAAVLEERRAPNAPPEYNPNMAPRPDASARSGTRPSALPPAISGATKADSSMGPPTLAGEDGPLGFHSTEMGGGKLSDSYSFIQTNFTSDKGYNPILKNFESLVSQPTLEGFAGAGAGAGAGARPPAIKVSAKEAKLLSDFESYSASRDRDIPGPLRRQ